jgi:hypothetical protein
MTIENDAFREDLRAWIRSPAIGVPDYSADLLVQRRVGGMLANSCMRHRAENVSTETKPLCLDSDVIISSPRNGIMGEP